LEARLKYEENLNQKDWKCMIGDKIEGLLLQNRDISGNYKAVKAQAFINHSPEQIFFTITNTRLRKIFDT
jgi:hypothetical protein